VIVEEAGSASFTAPAGYTELERRSYGDSELILLRRTA
jgi:16S rRNA (guanine966-N2)-methyltransferase